MSRALRNRIPEPALPPKGKVAQPLVEAADAIPYSPAKLRTPVLSHVKAYCAEKGIEMQTYLSDVAEADLRARGFLPGTAHAG
jgi:hypothetical protein